MMNEKFIKQLPEKNIKVWLEDEYLGIYSYNPEKKRYQGEFGYLSIEAVIKCLKGSEEYNHLRIEIDNGND